MNISFLFTFLKSALADVAHNSSLITFYIYITIYFSLYIIYFLQYITVLLIRKIIKIMKKIILLVFTFYSVCNLFSQPTFTDVAGTLGVNDAGAGQGVVFLDVNNDGWLDIFLVNNNTPSKLWINTGGTVFTESSAAWGVNITIPTRGISAADYNNDGFLDVMIGSWQQTIRLYQNNGSTFTDVSAAAGVSFMGYGGTINWFDYNIDGKVDVVFGNNGLPPRYNYFFHNNDLQTFSDVAYSIGLTDSVSTLTFASGDYDNDGDIDLFCGSQTNISPTGTILLYKNEGNGTFTDVTLASLIVSAFYNWGAEWGDYNNDGYLDLFMANTNGTNLLYKNNGNSTFTDVTSQMGVGDPGGSYSCGWADYDNDGDLDLYVSRGTNYQDKMYRNDGTVFTDVSTQVGMGDQLHSAAVSWGDFDKNGFPDLYLVNNGTANRLYQNSGGNGNNWINISLVGMTTNKSAIGTRVRVVAGSLNMIREVEGGSGGKGQNSLSLEFGVGTASVIDSVIINWQSGIVQILTNVSVNQFMNVTESSTGITNLPGSIPEYYFLKQNYPNPFNPSTTVEIGIKKSGFAELRLYDITGREIKMIYCGHLKEGEYRFNVDFSNSNYNSGVYFYNLKINDFNTTNKMLFLK